MTTEFKRDEIEDKLRRVLAVDGAIIGESMVFMDRLIDCLEAIGLIRIDGEKWRAKPRTPEHPLGQWP